MRIQQIVPPVADPHVSVSTPPLVWPSNRLGYVNARQRWWVGVRFGSDADALIFKKAVEGTQIRLIEFEGKFYIEDPQIPDSASMDAPDRYAEEELPCLNAAVKLLCPQYLPARFYCGVDLSKGYGQSIVSSGPVLLGHKQPESIVAFLRQPSTDFPAIRDLWTRNADVREALFYFGSDGNPWSNLYKVTEIIEEYSGSERELLDQNWCSRSTWERFRRTANHQEAIGMFSRHARSKAKPPSDPMSIEEARSFARDLLQGWIHELLRH